VSEVPASDLISDQRVGRHHRRARPYELLNQYAIVRIYKTPPIMFSDLIDVL